jgi:hypothetical protein
MSAPTLAYVCPLSPLFPRACGRIRRFSEPRATNTNPVFSSHMTCDDSDISMWRMASREQKVVLFSTSRSCRAAMHSKSELTETAGLQGPLQHAHGVAPAHTPPRPVPHD